MSQKPYPHTFTLVTVATQPRPTLIAMATILEYLGLNLEINFVSNKEFAQLYVGDIPENDFTLCIVNEVAIQSLRELMDHIHNNNLWQHGAIKR